jgi:hypothetical protein
MVTRTGGSSGLSCALRAKDYPAFRRSNVFLRSPLSLGFNRGRVKKDRMKRAFSDLNAP